jgi:hypothetical protein
VQRHFISSACTGGPAQTATFFAHRRKLQRHPSIVGHILKDFTSLSLGPEFRDNYAAYSSFLGWQAHCSRSAGKAYAEPPLAQKMEHHVHVVKGQPPAFGKHSRFLSQYIEVEPGPVPGDNRVAVSDHPRQILYELHRLVPVHSAGGAV